MNNDAALWLLPTVTLSLVGADAVFHDASRRVRLEGIGPWVDRISRWLDGEHGEELLEQPLGRQLVEILDQQGWVVRLEQPLSCLARAMPERTRQLAYFAQLARRGPDRAFRELEAARVLIIGTGGIGSHAAFHLLASGVGQLVLNDFDRVEASHLNRQILFTRADVGRPKVEVLCDALHDRFSQAHVETISSSLDCEDLARTIREVDLVLLCGEHPAPLDRPEILGDRAIITAGYFGHETFVGPVVSPAHGTAPWGDVMRRPERLEQSALEQTARCLVNHWNCSGATNNGLGGALLGEAAVRLLAPSLGGPILRMTRRFVDMRSLSMRDEVWRCTASGSMRAPVLSSGGAAAD